MTPDDRRYFDRIETELDRAREVANRAKQRGDDPRPEVEIPVAKDMADRVENILEIDGIAARIRTLETETTLSREEIALELVADFVDGTVGDYETTAGKIEGAVRTAVALLTEGVVAAPIEGIDRVVVDTNDDGSSFVTIYYAGPIRSAGGTAQALSVLVADYARSLLGVDRFVPRDTEIDRYVEEVGLYDDETGLQYSPKDSETAYIVEHCPIMLDGEATGDEEVSGYRDLERIDTNAPRGGMCLVLAEGIALKAPKIKRYTDSLEEVTWPWLDELIDGTVDEEAAETDTSQPAADEDDPTAVTGPPRVEPNKKYLRDLIAGRPVFSHPSAAGGFRLRYGRTRNLGHATAGIHPATMHIVDDFLAPGTQIKTELPGKAAGVVPVDSIEGPTVKLANGEFRRIDDVETAKRLRNGVETIVDVGEYLVNYGEFVENNQPLAPASYAVEWWQQEFAATDADLQALADDVTVDLTDPAPTTALTWASEYDAPLHPAYTYLWHDITVEAFQTLTKAIRTGEIVSRGDAAAAVETDLTDGFAVPEDDVLVLPGTVSTILESLLVEHIQTDDSVYLPTWRPLVRSAGFSTTLDQHWETLPADAREWPNAVQAVNAVAPFEVRERAPTRVGNRMGRPEKSEVRELSPAVHTLFPIGDAGGDQRDVSAAATHTRSMQAARGAIDAEVGTRKCTACNTTTHWPRCPECGDHIEPHYTCPDCDQTLTPDESGRVVCERCDTPGTAVETKTLDLHDEYRSALSAVGERETSFEILKGVKGLSSSLKTPEPIEKGILRAKHDVSVFKDGTVRYDITDLPVTTVTPAELNVSADRLRELGYTEDIHGDPLRHDDQLVELNVQDIVLSNGAAEHMYKTANFVDDLLSSYYGLEPYYDLEAPDDIVGELVFGMAPHTSAAVVGRVVGIADVSAGYAHPYFHAAKRRNCFHPETKVWYCDEAGVWHHDRIETLVEERLNDPRHDDFGALVAELDGEVVVPSIDDTGQLTTQPVTAVSKHPAPDHLVRIETRSGREITLTPDHDVHTIENDTLRSKRAGALTTDDTAVVPDGLEVVAGRDEPPVLDLLAAFLEADDIDPAQLFVQGLTTDQLAEHVDEERYDAFVETEQRTQPPGPSHSPDGLSAALLCDIFESREAVLEFVPDEVTLTLRGDSPAIDRCVELDEHVGTVLGYYAAGGYTQVHEKASGTVHQTTIHSLDAAARDVCTTVLTEAFGITPTVGETTVTVHGALFRIIVESVLDAGHTAATKRVPQLLFDAPSAVVAAYLRGCFSGSGGVEPTTVVSATTASRELKEDLLALLSRLGLHGQARQATTKQRPECAPTASQPTTGPAYTVELTADDAVQFTMLTQPSSDVTAPHTRRVADGGATGVLVDPITTVEHVESTVESVYDLTVAETHTLVANNMSQKQCDGDEDCVMLLMDGLLNFSKAFLPDARGGQMDAPLVMSSRIDPAEIDDEAHNVDTMTEYPRAFYEATRDLAHPDAVADLMTLAGDSVGTDDEYHGFAHSHVTTDIAAGPALSAYKTLEGMPEKTDAQLQLARRLRAVDATDVAERIIEYHFLPDLLGNLRAFSRQEFRCLDCGADYRRPPLTGSCRECAGTVTLTVHEGSVTKYLDTAITIADEYDAREYTKQRLEVLKRSIDRIFEDDTNRQTGIADFM